MTKRILAIVLTLVFAAVLIPANALAADTYSVTYDLTNLTADNGDQVTYGENFDVTLKPADGYFNAESVEVTTDGESVNYTYDKETGVLTIDGYSITGNINIKADAREPELFTLYNRINNSTCSPDAMTEGEEFVTYITPDEDFRYPESVELYSLAFADPVSEELYTYDPETGKLVIDGSVIIANIELVGECIPYSFEAYCYQEYVVFTGSDEAIYGEDYLCNVKARRGYEIYQVQVLCGTTEWLEEGVDFVYDPETGDVTVFSSAVTGKLDIVAHTDWKEFDVTYNVTNITVEGEEKVTATYQYNYFLTPNDGYALPEDVTITVDGEVLAEGVGYELENRYEHELVIRIYGEYVLGDIVITANAVYIPKVIDVSYELENLTAENTDDATEGEDYKTVLTPAEGYSLPESVTVSLNGNAVSADAYKYDSETGELTVLASAFAELDESDNVIVIAAAGEENSAATTPGGNGTDTPDTGDTDIVTFCASLMLASLCGIAVVSVKRRKVN